MPLGCQYHQGYEYHPKTIDFPLKEYDIGQWLGSSDISEQDNIDQFANRKKRVCWGGGVNYFW